MARNYLNNVPATSLNGAVNDTTTTWTVNSSTGYPSTDFTAKCESEVVLVTNVAGTTWTVTRGFDNTTAVSHTDGKEVRAVICADDLDRTWLHLPLAGGTMVGDTINVYFDTEEAGQSAVGYLQHTHQGTPTTTQLSKLTVTPARFAAGSGNAWLIMTGQSEDSTVKSQITLKTESDSSANIGYVELAPDTASLFVYDAGGNSGVRAYMSGGVPSIFFQLDGSSIMEFGGTGVLDSNTVASGAPSIRFDQAGSVTAPSYAFTNDVDTGMYRTGADAIGFTIAGTLRLHIESTGISSTVPILTSDGTKALPSYSFASDTNTGIYSTANGVISFSSNDTLVAEITAGGITAGVPGFVTFGVEGSLTSGTGTQRWYAPFDLNITRATLALGTASSSGNVEVDINRSGTTIFTTQTLRPICAASSNFDASGTPDGTTTMTKDTHYLTVDWDAIGTGAADATVTVEFIST